MADIAFTRAASIPMLQTLGIRLVESGPEHAVMEVTVSEGHANFYGGTHSGLLATLADTACFFPRPLIPSGARIATTNFSLNYLRPASVGERLRGRAQLLRLGRRTANLEVRIETARGNCWCRGVLCCRCLKRGWSRGVSCLSRPATYWGLDDWAFNSACQALGYALAGPDSRPFIAEKKALCPW